MICSETDNKIDDVVGPINSLESIGQYYFLPYGVLSIRFLSIRFLSKFTDKSLCLDYPLGRELLVGGIFA